MTQLTTADLVALGYPVFFVLGFLYRHYMHELVCIMIHESLDRWACLVSHGEFHYQKSKTKFWCTRCTCWRLYEND